MRKENRRETKLPYPGCPGKVNERKLVGFLAKNGQQVLPMVDLIAQSKMAIDDLVDVMGRATIETVLQLSAEQVATDVESTVDRTF